MSDIEAQDETPQSPTEGDVEWSNDLRADEVNDLLGFDLSAEEGEDRAGLRALINSVLVSHRRLPMLDVIFDRAARQMTTSLRQLTNDNVEVALDDISSMRFGDFVHSVETRSVIGVLKAEELGNYCLLAVDMPLVYSVVDLLLGGRRGGAVLAIEDRNFTQIELGLVQRVIALMAEDLTVAFKPVADVSFSLERIETTPRFAAIAQEASVCTLAKFRIDMEERGGRAAILAPHATLEPIYKTLLRDFIGDVRGSEEAWRDHLAEEIAAATLDLKVVLAEKEITIDELGRLAPGATIRFPASATNKAEIRAGGTVIANGDVGRTGKTIAIRLSGGPAPAGAADDEAA